MRGGIDTATLSGMGPTRGPRPSRVVQGRCSVL